MFAEFEELRKKYAKIERIAQDIYRIDQEVQGSLRLADEKIERNRKEAFSKLFDFREKLAQQGRFLEGPFQTAMKDFGAVTAQISLQDKDIRATEFYINRVLPIRSFSSTCNLLHAVLNNKDDVNNLLIYEQKKY